MKKRKMEKRGVNRGYLKLSFVVSI